MSLAGIKVASFALLLLTAGLPVYFGKLAAPQVGLPKNSWATPHDTPAFDVAWMPAGDALQGVINPARGGLHNVATYHVGQEAVSELSGYRSATAVAVAEDGTVLIGTELGNVYRIKDGQSARLLETSAQDPAIQSLVALAGGRMAVGCGASIRLVDAQGKLLWTQEIAWDGLNSLAASADGLTLVAGSHLHRIAVIDVCTGRIVNRIETRMINPVAAVSRDGRHVYGGGLDGTLTAWNALTGEIEWMRSCGEQQVSRVDVSPDGRRIAAGGWNDAVTIWSEAGELMEIVPVSKTAAIRFSPDGTALALSTQNGGVQVVPLGVQF